MKISAYKIGDTGDAQVLDLKTCLEQRSQDDGVRWIDIEGFEPEELSNWLKPLDLSPLTLEFCREAGEGTRVAPLADALRILDNVSSGQATCFPLLAGLDGKILELNQPEDLRQVIASGAQHN